MRRLASVFILSLLALSTGCANDKKVISGAVDTHKTLAPAVLNDPQLADYIQRVGDRIVAEGRAASLKDVGPKKHFDGEANDWMFSNSMKFHFVNSKTLNAFTTGGEHMYIYTELFEQCKTEDELAAVMSHEYAHVYSRHVQKGMDNRIALLGLAGAGAVGGAVVGGKDNWQTGAAVGGGAGLAAGSFAGMSFTRKDENEADKYGYYFYTHAGWDPKQFAGFFQDMIDKGYDKTPAILSDHPTLASRVKATEERTKDLPPEAASWRKPPIASPSAFRDLQSRAAKIGKTAPSDASLDTQKLLAALPRSCVQRDPDPADRKQAEQQLVAEAKTTPAPKKVKRRN